MFVCFGCVVQSCYLKFGSWTYDGFMVDISFHGNVSEVDISDYVVSNEWELVEHPGRRNVRYYACCGDQPYPDLTFTLRLRRLSAFYNYTIMLPCVLLSCLTAVIFWLPPESPAKIMLGLSARTLTSTFLSVTRTFCVQDNSRTRLHISTKHGRHGQGVTLFLFFSYLG